MPLNKNIITLSRHCNTWIATFSGPHAKEVQRAFNSVVIPTAWTTDTGALTVAKAIEERNPDCLVLVA